MRATISFLYIVTLWAVSTTSTAVALHLKRSSFFCLHSSHKSHSLYSLLFSRDTIKNTTVIPTMKSFDIENNEGNESDRLLSSTSVTVTTPVDDSSRSQIKLSMGSSKTKYSLMLQLGFYYFLLYTFTVVYNVANKDALTYFPFPTMVNTIQLCLGVAMFLPLWLHKGPPKLVRKIFKSTSLLLVTMTHLFGNVATIFSLQSGSVSFTHVVKSAEPVFSAVLSAITTKTLQPYQVYLSLMPIMAGVAVASMTELSFSWFSFLTAMASNLFYQTRIVVSKQILTNDMRNEETSVKLLHNNNNSNGSSSSSNNNSLDSNSSSDKMTKKFRGADLFRVITFWSALFSIPVMFLLEGAKVKTSWSLLTSTPLSNPEHKVFLTNLLISGFSYYAYNEIAFWILDLVHPITHAIGNTLKRVVLIVAAMIIFRTPQTVQGALGSAVAVLGSFLYAWVKEKEGCREKAP